MKTLFQTCSVRLSSVKKLAGGVLAGLLFLAGVEGIAAPIVQDRFIAMGVFSDPYFKGQTFTAEDPFISTIGVSLVPLNPRIEDRRLSMSLYEGAGLSGNLLGTQTLEPFSDGTRVARWVDFDFSSITLTPGSVYSLVIRADSPYWGAQYNQPFTPGGGVYQGDDYAGGVFFSDSGMAPILDLRFRVIPVPEPAVFWMASLGMIALVGQRLGRRPHRR